MENNIIRFNSYKLERGGSLYDMYDQFNARVGDQGTPLVMQWTQGLTDTLIDLQAKKLHFYATGQVGQYLEKLKDGTGYQMSADASQVEYEDRNAAGTMDHGITKVKLPKQFFPQEGIFYGYFGLKDDQGNTYTSVNVWFRVLGGVPIMGAAIPYFSTRFDELMETCQGRIEDVLAQLRQEYQDEVKKNEDMSAETRAALSKLADAVGAVQAQIDAQDIVKRQDFSKLSSLITDKLTAFNDTPQYYANADEMKSNNPNGTDKLCITLNDDHRYLYQSGNWVDCGVAEEKNFGYAKAASENLTYGQDIMSWSRTPEGTFGLATENFAKYEEQSILHMHSDAINQYVRATSPVMTVLGHTISVQFPECVRNTSGFSHSFLEINQFAAGEYPEKNSSYHNKDIRINFTNDSMTLLKSENIALDQATEKIRLQVVMYNTAGDVYVGMPKINYGPTCIPYSHRTLKLDLDRRDTYSSVNSEDLLYGITVDSMLNNTSSSVTATRTGYNQFPNRYMVDFKNNGNGWASEATESVEVRSGQAISAQIPGRVIAGNGYFIIREFADKWGNKKLNEQHFPISNRLTLNRYRNIQIGDNTTYITAAVALQNQGELVFGMPKLNYGSKCIRYDNFYGYDDADNLLNEDIEFDTSQRIFTLPADDADHLDFDTVNQHAQYPTLKTIRIPVDGDKPISYQLPYQSSGNIWIQLRYSSTMNDNTQTNITQKLSPVKDKTIYKSEGVALPKGTKSVALWIWPEDGETGTIWVPKLNYGNHCMPYNWYDGAQSTNTVTEDRTSSIAKLYINSGSQNYNKVVPFKFTNSSQSTSGYLSYDVQGDSSRDYEKKNFKIKLFKDSEGNEKLKVKILQSWKKNNKYNLKANWIDATQARNVVNARLVKDAIAVTSLSKPSLTPILDTPDFGQVNGIPVEVYFDGDFFGLYTLNTKKDDVTFAMDAKRDSQEVISTGVSHSTFADPNAVIDGNNYQTEIHDTSSDEINANFTKLLQFVNSSTDEDFKNHIADYIDVNSVINEMLFGILSHEYDFYGKSILLATWNSGTYWYMIPYDLDSTWGLSFRGDAVYNNDDFFNLSLAATGDRKANAIVGFNGNPLLDRIFKAFKPEIKAQGQRLRSSVWSTQAIISKFRDFIDDIPVDSYQKEQSKWTTLPSVDITSFNQIQNYVIKRGQEFDSFLSQLA